MTAFDVKTKQGVFTELHMGNAYSTERIGEPRLPAQKRLVAVPFGATVKAKVANISDVKTIKLADYGINNKLMPKQYDMPKNMKPEDMPFSYKSEAYTANRYNESEIVKVEVLGVMRGVNIARVTVEPIRYNPITNEIQVYSDIEVELSYENADYAKTQQMFKATYSPFYDAPYAALLNIDDIYDDMPDFMTPPHVKMLVVANRMFEETLAPFLEWKTKMGYELIMGYTDEIGSSESEIKAWIQQQYNTGVADENAPDFLIIVGDVQQVKASATGQESDKKTDLYYASVDGDIFPEMYYSRLSAQNTQQLQNQLDKILYYEQYQIEDPSYLDDVTLIAGADGNWNPISGQVTIKYGTQNYFNTEHGYATVNDYLDSYAGCYDPERIAVSFINYTAHCGETIWGDPRLTINDVYNFENINKYPIAIGNCCLAADFGFDECIGEAWMRAENKGAVGYIGSSPSSYWYEDTYWSLGAYDFQSDGVVPSVDETSLGSYDAPWNDTYNVCLSSLHFVGNLAVTQAHEVGYSGSVTDKYYWEAYCTFGDASLMPFNTQPSANEVSHMGIFPIGMDTYEVSAQPDSWVGISKDGMLVGSGYVGETGSATIEITPVTSSGNVDIVVSKAKHIPYVASVPAAALEGPYVIVDSYEFEDGTMTANYGTTKKVNLSVKNVGADAGNNVNITFSVDDEYCSIVGNNTLEVGSIAADEVKDFTAVIDVKVADDVLDNHSFKVKANIEGSDKANHEWESKMNFKALAPELMFAEVYEVDDASGNGDGRIDAGETVMITIALRNNGHAASLDASTLALASASDYVSLTATNVEVPSIDAEAVANIAFELTADANTPEGTIAPVHLDIAAGQYTAHTVLSLPIGEIVEDFETGDFTAFAYSFGSSPWVIQQDEVYEGTYAMRSAPNMQNSDASTVTLQYNDCAAGEISFYRKVSSENNYDKLYFYIDGQEKGNWSGEKNWEKVAYEVEAGSHTFKWEYKKDYSQSSGQDAAWVDLIVLPAAADENAVVSGFTALDNTINAGESVEFMSQALGNVTSWNWTFDGGVPATSTDENPVVQYNNNGMYSVTLEVSNGTNTSTLTKNNFVLVGFDTLEDMEEMTDASVKFYPNPNNGTFYVDIQGVEDADMYIYSATGELVYQESNMIMDNSIKQISLNNASEGVYVVVIANKTHKLVEKIIIK